MSENYLPVKESLGYKNVKMALWKVFLVDLNNVSIHEGEDENFSFPFKYNSYRIVMGISSTGKNMQFEAGEGGLFNIWFDSYVGERFTITFLYKLIADKSISNDIRRVFGKDEKSVEHAMQVLKDFLDSDDAKVLLKDE